ncbi:MAG: Crp/Fnr family transcriptional regulator [Hydrococcus sp. Prado102]|nr:Crp/Fnr family transcriptional regulator [Hydrococcus sp. Prado102]
MDLLTVDRLPPILRSAIATRQLVAGQRLFRQGDSASAVFVIESGRLKIVRNTEEGKPITIEIARAGESFAESALFSEFYSYTAIAEVTSEVIAYPKQPLLSTLRDRPDLAEDFMTLLVRKNNALIVDLELQSIKAAHRRVLQYLQYLVGSSDSKVVSFDRPLKDVAGEIGLNPATLSRALTRLENEGAIARELNSIILQDFSAA